MTYDFAGSYTLNRVEKIWEKAYNLIANTNLIIKNCDERREVLPDDYYQMIKGEALALRGFLHFDLFRLFGPVYGVDSTLESIPYYKEFALDVQPTLIGTEFMKNVIVDLRAAKDLLSTDPIITNGVAGDPSDKFKSKRNLRLNYYAVQGLLSRAYMYIGELDSALVYAQNVIDVHERIPSNEEIFTDSPLKSELYNPPTFRFCEANKTSDENTLSGSVPATASFLVTHGKIRS